MSSQTLVQYLPRQEICSVLLMAFPILLFCYYRAKPWPIPGVPYLEASARSVLGDMPALVQWKNDTGEFTTFLFSDVWS